MAGRAEVRIALAVLLAYATSLGGGFVWVDHVEIEEGGYRVRSAEDLGSLWRLTLDQYLDRDDGPVPSRGGYWRPLYALSISVDWVLWGPRPLPYRLENLAWHMAVCLGLLRLGQAMRLERRAVFWSVLLFAVHPLGVQSVAWISGRKDLLCAAWGIAALLVYDQGLDARTRRAAIVWQSLALVFMAMAALSKELGMVVPVVAALVLHRRWGDVRPASRRGAVLSLLSLFAVCLAIAGYRQSALGGFALHTPHSAAGPWGGLATSAGLCWHYAGLTLLPRAPNLSDAWPLASSPGVADLGMVAALCVALLAVLVGLYRRAGWALAAAWTVVWLVPASGLFPLRHLRAERYLYPASWGLLLLAAMAVLYLAERWRVGRHTAQAAMAAVGVLMGVLTAQAGLAWRSDEALFADSVARDPQHAEGWLGLAEAASRRADYGAAIEYARRAQAILQSGRCQAYCSRLVLHTNLGLAYYRRREMQPALEHFQNALAVSPNSARAHYHVALAAFALEDYATAKTHYQDSLTLRPGDFFARSNLAVTCLRLHELEPAIGWLEPLVRERPEDLTNQANLGSALLALGRYSEAMEHFRYVTERSPEDPLALAKLAWCLHATGYRDSAATLWRKAVAIAPEEPVVQSVGRLLGLQPQAVRP